MDWYPTIYHPYTKQPIKLFSDDVMALLSEGYKEYDLFTAPRVKYNHFLTHLEDIDYQILMHIPIEQLMSLCQTDKYTSALCNNRQFWINRIVHDELVMPDAYLLERYTQWFKIYKFLDSITSHIHGTLVFINREKDIKILTKHYPDINNILIPIDRYDSGQFTISQDCTYDPYIPIPNQYCVYQDFSKKAIVDKQTVVNFLFEGLMDHYLDHYLDSDDD